MKKEEKVINFQEYKKEKRREEFAKKIEYVGEIQIPEQYLVVGRENQNRKEIPRQSFENDIKTVRRENQNKQKVKKEKRKIKKIVRAEAIVLVGLVAVAVGVKIHSDRSVKEIQQEQQNKKIKANKEMSQEDMIKQAVNKMKTKEDVWSLLNNMYVELHEQETGDTELTTEDIELGSHKEPQDYVFVNNETGEVTLHGKTPDATKQKLENDGISWHKEYDVDAYRVRKDGKIIDIMVHMNDGKLAQAKEGEQYEEYDENYVSILQKMGKVVPAGLKYAQKIEEKNIRDSEIAVLKRDFIDSLQEFVKNENEIEIENLTAKEPAIEEDDLEL